MGLLYSAAFDNVTMTDAAQDIVFLQTSAAVPIIIHEILITSNVTTDVRARIAIVRRSTAGSSGTAITPRALYERNSVSAATTATYLRTTVGTVGNLLDADQWSMLVPFQRLYTPETRIAVASSGFLGVNLVAGTGASRVISGKIVFEEG
jgi:hypothetical protein